MEGCGKGEKRRHVQEFVEVKRTRAKREVHQTANDPGNPKAEVGAGEKPVSSVITEPMVVAEAKIIPRKRAKRLKLRTNPDSQQTSGRRRGICGFCSRTNGGSGREDQT